jgi:lipopolysaccharide/colanic/teichoic acid biosynthesis glycosyltransferase
MSVEGNLYDRNDASAVVQCLKDLVQVWQSLDATIHRARRVAPGVWSDTETKVEPSVRFIGPAWIGAGRDRLESPIVIGPALIWDARDREPASSDLEWQEIEPRPAFERPVRVRRSSFYRITKRAFDTVFAAAVLLFVLPLFPIVMLAIWLEDGRPFFFVHRRETVGGREFPCIKFRSMRKDADAIKADLAQKNRADGPQFFIDPDDDPRLTKVGGLLRKLNLDELPQFLNVLAGQMSVVGPRPSPRSENQCCPPWREARLSVRPGITGLWQMMRTRQQGLDFQEWIKYDIEYVETAGWRLDLWIIWKTVLLMLRLGD